MILDELIAADYIFTDELANKVFNYCKANSVIDFFDLIPSSMVNTLIGEIEYYNGAVELKKYLEAQALTLADEYKVSLFYFLSPDNKIDLIRKTNVDTVITESIITKIISLENNLYSPYATMFLDELLTNISAHMLATIASQKEYAALILSIFDDLTEINKNIVIPFLNQDAFNIQFMLNDFGNKLKFLEAAGSEQKINLLNSKFTPFKINRNFLANIQNTIQKVEQDLNIIYDIFYGLVPNIIVCEARVNKLYSDFFVKCSNLKIKQNKLLLNKKRIFQRLILNSNQRNIRYIKRIFTDYEDGISESIQKLDKTIRSICNINRQFKSVFPPKLISPLTQTEIETPIIDRYGNIMCYKNLQQFNFQSPYNRRYLTADDYVIISKAEALKLLKLDITHNYLESAKTAKELRNLIDNFLIDDKKILGKRKRLI